MGSCPSRLQRDRSEPASEPEPSVDEPSSSSEPEVAVVPPTSEPIQVAQAYYAVWVIPGSASAALSGCWFGPASCTWTVLSTALPGQRYIPNRGIHLRRVRNPETLDHAVEIYRAEASRHAVRSEPTLHCVVDAV
jgi:hypothetical protein